MDAFEESAHDRIPTREKSVNCNQEIVVNLLLLGFIGLAVYFWLKPAPATTVVGSTPVDQTPVKILPDGRPAPVDPDAAKQGKKESFGPDPAAMLAFATAMIKPFELVGKVVDQYGDPVPLADVTWGANNSLDTNKSGTRGQTRCVVPFIDTPL